MSIYSVLVNDLFKRFGNNRVFQNISFEHNDGILGIAGSNGSGKSTLLKCMAGLCAPTKGEIIWYCKDKKIDMEAFKTRLGYAAPYVNLYSQLSCRENLQFLLRLRNYADPVSRMTAVLEKTAMAQYADHLFGNLSTGQQQRMRLAALLVHEPDVLFLDEPGANLDASGNTLIRQLVSESKKAGKLIVIASNNSDELSLCDTVFSVEGQQFQEG